MKRWSLAARLALSVVPIALIALLAGAFAVWTLVETADGSPGPVGDLAIGEQTAFLVSAIAVVVFTAAVWFTYALGRSVVRRVQSVTDAATKVAEVDLPNLVEALRNPHQDLAELPAVELDPDGDDEIGELAGSFQALHSTLIDVAGQQMEILRRGVSEIFVTLARRNRSLVDRQLALIDDLESREEDPEILGGYYKLDHFATRMRRNAESLLVLAGAEPPRVWAKPLELSEVIRGALGEVDDYQRIDVLAMEPTRLSGSAVTDVAHLVSELLDNATQYSPPTERVRVAGMFDPDGYLITISDNGLGMSDARIAELNRILEQPPALGLALEPTLGIYVVARLAARHGIKVVLIAGVVGITVRITIPRTLLDVGKRVRPSHVAGGDEGHRPDRFEEPPMPQDELAVSEAGGQYVFRRNPTPEPARPSPEDQVTAPREPARTSQETAETAAGPLAEPDLTPDGGSPALRQTKEPAPELTEQAQDPEPAVTSSEEMRALTERLARRTGDGRLHDGARTDYSPRPTDEHGDRPPGSLPVRTPGASYREDEDESASSVTADGAIGIRSALSAYEKGRDAASRHGSHDDAAPHEHEGERSN